MALRSNSNYKTGKLGEQEALEFLENKNYRLLEKNLRLGHWELDLLMVFQNQLIAIEVKTKTRNQKFLRNPFRSSQLKRVSKIASQYATENQIDYSIRIDGLIVCLETNAITHLENLFFPGL